MSGDTLGVLLAVIISMGTALAGAITAWRRAPADNVGTLTTRISTLEKKDRTKDDMIGHLSDWQIHARLYIMTLRSVLADRGIPSPPPPKELDIWHPPKGAEGGQDDESG